MHSHKTKEQRKTFDAQPVDSKTTWSRTVLTATVDEGMHKFSRYKLRTITPHFTSIYNMRGGVASGIRTKAEGELLYVWYNTDENIAKHLWNKYM